MLTVFCPSRGRPEEAQALLDSFLATKTTDARLVFLVDRDDPSRYPGEVLVGAPTGDPTGPLNVATEVSSADVGFCGDDTRFLTPGWDGLVVAQLRDGPAIVWGMDGTSQKPWPSTCFISSGIVKALGYMVPPTLRRGYFDVFWIQLATATGVARTVDALFKHDNSAGDPSSPNFKPERRVPPEVIEADRRAYGDWQLTSFASDCRKVRALSLARFF